MDKRYCVECGYEISDYADGEDLCGACLNEVEIRGLSLPCPVCNARVGVPCDPGCPTREDG